MIKEFFKKTLPYVMAAGLSAILLSGCKKIKTEYSEVMREEARVVSKEHRNAWLQPIPYYNAATKTTNFMYIPHSEENRIGFEGKIKFNIDNKEIFNRFHENDLADVTYREIYRATYDDVDKDGEKDDLIKRIQIGYDFLDAQLKQE